MDKKKIYVIVSAALILAVALISLGSDDSPTGAAVAPVAEGSQPVNSAVAVITIVGLSLLALVGAGLVLFRD